MKNIFFNYNFTFADGRQKNFNVSLDGNTLELQNEKRDSYPDWTRMDNFQCPNCPVDKNTTGYCPVVTNLCDLIDYFKDSISYEEVDIDIETAERTYRKHASLQGGLNSLIGIYMVTSGCPVMEKLKPMVRFHLPFATVEESSFRMISMYLMAQYFLKKNGQQPDWELSNLVNIYNDIRVVNRNFCSRLSQIKVKDATINSLITLDCFAFSISYFIDKDKMEKLEELFDAYLK